MCLIGVPTGRARKATRTAKPIARSNERTPKEIVCGVSRKNARIVPYAGRWIGTSDNYGGTHDSPHCTWTEREHSGVWSTDCNEIMVIGHPIGPLENGMVYCCFCGKRLREAAPPGYDAGH